MIPEIKICGIKTEEEVQLMNHFPVTYIGFIFAKSKRQLTLEKAAYLRPLVRGDIKVVGVFMNQDLEFIKEAIEHCSLDVVQLHGGETDDMFDVLPKPVWKSIPVKGEESLELLKQYPSAKGLLLDTYHKGATGGTGKQFNWNLVNNLDLDQTLILAGGLNPDNILEAIETVKPDVVDLNSGLETDLIKDPEKVERLFDVLSKEEKSHHKEH